MNTKTQRLTASLVTCSFSGDFEICRLLCESVDRFVPPDIAHILYVPARDVAMFSAFAGPRRTIATQESLLPRWFVKAPLPGPKWRARLRLPRRNVYLTPFSAPVRGWIAQQIMKISAAAVSPTEIVVHVDSDNAFIRPLRLDQLASGERVRLYRSPEMVDLPSHRKWHAAAAKLLGLPEADYHGAEYIDQIVVWRRSVVRALAARIAEIAGVDWRIALARTPHFAEYILYGVFADRVMGLDAAGLFPDAQSLCLSRWSGDFQDAAEEQAFIDAISSAHVACLIQSTLAMNAADRRGLFERAIDVAARKPAA
ncbi:MAG: hypothetical protein KGM42_11665 [Hyphomicrobiales bacterium]|nr:hypothetical protein [Hyphomicrobiales bacterium]